MDGQHLGSRSNRRLSLILPAYNEEAGIRRAISEADDALNGLVVDYEILVVDDGSSDRTAAVVADMAGERPHVRLLKHARNRGYGAALRTGFDAARFEFVAFTDADCQFHLADLDRLLPLAESHPVVVGYRLGRKDPVRRRFLSWGYNLLARGLLGTCVRDCDCAFKVFRHDVLPQLRPETDGFFVNTEMLTKARQRGYDVAEVGVRHRPRLHGSSTVSLMQVPRVLAALLPFWWGRVSFAGTPTGEAAAFGLSTRAAVLVLLIIAACLFFSQLQAPLLEPQEPRYAEIAREMHADGRILVPELNQEAYLDKPPLLYWLVMASYSLFGVSDTAARLVPGLAGVLTVLCTYLWGRRVVGERSAFCGALMLCLSARFVYLERMLTMDSVLCLWVVVGWAAAHTALMTGKLRRARWLLSAAACGLGVLTKGPVALALVLPPVLVYAWIDARCARIAWRNWAQYLGVMVGGCAPWFVVLMFREPDFAVEFFWKHNVLRFVQPFDHAEPVWFYLPGLLLGLLPWSLLLPGLVRFLMRHSRRTAARRPPALGFFLLAFGWALLFFSAAGCKRATYILPALPPLTLALGCYVNVLAPQTKRAFSWTALVHQGSRLASYATALAFVGSIAIVLAATYNEMLSQVVGFAFAGVALTLLIVVLRVRQVSWAVCAATTFLLLFAGIEHLLPAYNQQFALRAELVAEAERSAPDKMSIACYPQQYDSARFYVPAADVRVYSVDQRRLLFDDLKRRPETLLLVKSGKVKEDLLKDLPPSLEFVPRGKPGAVTVGWLRRRKERAMDTYAER
jgi:4-amino-4-deoxy-L-arabinose transferase-like glycosyltransferase